MQHRSDRIGFSSECFDPFPPSPIRQNNSQQALTATPGSVTNAADRYSVRCYAVAVLREVPFSGSIRDERLNTGAAKFLWIGFAILAIYVSIYPANFQLPAYTSSALTDFFGTCCGRPGRGDLLGNVLLFIPFGFLGKLAARPTASHRLMSVTNIRVLTTSPRPPPASTRAFSIISMQRFACT